MTNTMMPQSAPGAGRVAFVDRSKGIGIFLVVFFHAWRGLQNGDFAFGGSFMQAVDYTVYLFHMPLFFVLSGLFVARSLAKGRSAYIKGKLLTIYWPYLFWSIVTLGLISVVPSLTDQHIGLSDMLAIPYQPRLHLWFIFTLFLYSMIYAILPRPLPLLALAILGAAIATLPEMKPFAQYLSNFIFFVAGLAGAERWRGLMRFWPLALVAFIGSAYFAFAFNLSDLSIWVAPAGLFGSLLTMKISTAMTDGGWADRLWSQLGEASLAIYVLHYFFVGGMRFALHRVAPFLPGEVALLACVAAGIGFSMVVRKIALKLGVANYFGLGRS